VTKLSATACESHMIVKSPLPPFPFLRTSKQKENYTGNISGQQCFNGYFKLGTISLCVCTQHVVYFAVGTGLEKSSNWPWRTTFRYFENA